MFATRLVATSAREFCGCTRIRHISSSTGYMMALMVALHHSEERVPQPRCIVVNNVFPTAYLRQRSKLFAGAPGGGQISPRILARVSHATASMMALHYANTSLAVRSQSVACVANVARCRKYHVSAPVPQIASPLFFLWVWSDLSTRFMGGS